MQIEPMTAADIPEVATLLQACFHWLADREGFNATQRAFLTGERSSEQAVRDESRTRPHIVARQDGAILGMAAVKGHQLARLYVDPKVHRQGVGRALFNAAEGMIRQDGHCEMTVGALVAGAAAFYQSMGMQVTGSVEYEPTIFPDRKVTLLRKRLD